MQSEQNENGWKNGICKKCGQKLQLNRIKQKKNSCNRKKCGSVEQFQEARKCEVIGGIPEIRQMLDLLHKGKNCCRICGDTEKLKQVEDVILCEYCLNIQLNAPDEFFMH